MAIGGAHGLFQLMNIGLEARVMISPQFRVTFIILKTILDVHSAVQKILCYVTNATKFPAGMESLDWSVRGVETI